MRKASFLVCEMLDAIAKGNWRHSFARWPGADVDGGGGGGASMVETKITD